MNWWSPNNRKGFASKIFEISGDNLVSRFKTEGRNKIKNVLKGEKLIFGLLRQTTVYISFSKSANTYEHCECHVGI